MILEVPGLSSPYARTLLDESLGIIQDMQMWSFQLKTAGWLTPGLLFPGGPGTSVGTVSVTAYSDTVVGSAAASAAWNAYSGQPFFTQLQFRSPFYSTYSIISLGTSGPFTTLKLDRPWMEPTMATASYMIYQSLFPVPVPDFKRFLWARDTTNNAPIDYTSYSQRDLAIIDPERTIFDDPGWFVPYEVDQRPGSSTLGQLLIELWPNPLSVLPYTYGYLRRGPRLTQPGDTVPYPFTEELILWRAKEAAFVWKEAQRGEEIQRGSGADWKFLIEQARDEFKIALKPIKDRDSDLVALYFARLQSSYPLSFDGYANINGTLNVGRW